jgi:hypothetical protein
MYILVTHTERRFLWRGGGGERHPVNSKKRRSSSQSAFCSLLYEQKEMKREAVRRGYKRGEEALVGVGDSMMSWCIGR